VLTSVANMLRPCCRMGDLLVRWGGEEFLLMLPETKQEEARAMAERIRQIIAAQPVQTNAESIPVTFSVGLAELRPNETLDELIAAADAALYVAKADGRDCVRVRG
jgi:diguanylate cyclase (GGDEF)-like protein